MKQQFWSAAALAVMLGFAGCKTVTINSTPTGAKAQVTGQNIGTTPTSVEVNLFQSHRVSVQHPGYEGKVIDVNVNSPDFINVILNRQFKITSNPSGADLYVNGEFVGQTPVTEVAIVDDGSATVEVRKKGWLPAQMTVKPETPVSFSLTMDKDGSGRRLLDLLPTSEGVNIVSMPIFSDTDIGEHSPNVSSCKKLTNQPQNEFIMNFSLLPDGRTLVTSILEELYVKGRTEYRANIWQLNTRIAGAPRKAVTQGDYFDLHPNPSADGETLFFSTTRNGRLGIWNLNLNGKGGLRTVTMGNTADYSPALKPWTKLIYYSAVLPGSSSPAYIWNKPANGGMPEQLTEGRDPQWNPRGNRLLYHKGSIQKNRSRIWVCDPDGGNQTQLSMGSGNFNDINARWSPDGRKIIFSSNRSLLKGVHNYDIYIMDADGGNVTQLTTNGSHDDKPVFGPDGKTVFFRSNRGLVWDIWTMQIR